MALIKCPECGKEVSSKALQCPNCGFPIPENGVEDKQKEDTSGKIVLKSTAIKVICYITVIIGLFIPLGIIIPIGWGIGLSMYISGFNEAVYDMTYYEKLKKENFIVAIITGVLAVISIFIKLI